MTSSDNGGGRALMQRLAVEAAPGRPEGMFGGSITRLEPIDGLLLTAEHLQLMQAYAGALAQSVGAAGGPGVVSGLTPRIEGGSVSVAPGSAFNRDGLLLRLDEDAAVDLPDPGDVPPTAGNVPVWVVELAHTEWEFGDEEIFRRLCDDPCAGGGERRPYSAEGVSIELTPTTADVGELADRDVRSAVARWWFAGEQVSSPDELLIATSERSPTATNLASDLWGRGTEITGTERVALGVLLRPGDEWVLDMWMARRDRIDPPARRLWQWRLGMRPWDVFVAQVLQFQAHLSDLLARDLLTPDSDFGALPASGVLELPPAGYLPILDGDFEGPQDAVAALFPPGFDLRFCSCRPDDVSRAIEEAQHLDRIPLDGEAGPPVDILVPLDPSGTAGPPIQTDLQWVAFQRRTARRCPDDGEDTPRGVVVLAREVPDDQPTARPAAAKATKATTATANVSKAGGGTRRSVGSKEDPSHTE